MDRSPDSEDRRAYTRYELWFPVTLEVATHEVWCICRDACPGGLQVSSRVTLEIGQPVTAVFRIAESEALHRVKGRIARCWHNDHELVQAFPVGIAIEFEAPVRDLEEALIRRSTKPPAI